MSPRKETYRQGEPDDPNKPRPPSGMVRWEARDKQTGERLGEFVWAQSWFVARNKFFEEHQLECDPIQCDEPPKAAQPKEKECPAPASTSTKQQKAPRAPSSKSSRAKASKKRLKSASSSAPSRRRS